METSSPAPDRRYQESFDELMNGEDELVGHAVEARRPNGTAHDDDDDDDDDDEKEDWKGGEDDGATIGDVSSYSDRLKEIMGSDEDEDVRQEQEHDDELRPGSGTVGDESLATEVGGADESRHSIASTSSLLPSSLDYSLLRPWQYPKPKRLRSLASTANVTDDASLSPSLSLQAGDSGSNSFDFRSSPMLPASSHDDGSSIEGLPSAHMMPYGVPEKPIYASNGQTRRNDDAVQRSILRLSKVSKLELSQRNDEKAVVMAVAGGLVAVGTSQARVGMWEFNGRFKGWLALPTTTTDSVTALSISSDRTFIAIGTDQGHIYLYDVSKPRYPARHVAPTTPKAVTTGKNEGHLQGTKILHIGFVGARHTAIVSADEFGLSFYHSLGKILGVSSNDTLRLLGRYPSKAEREGKGTEVEALNNGGQEHEPTPPKYRQATALGMAPLPLGPMRHLSDSHNIVAILTPTKLVVVGLKPAARTWFRLLSPSRTIETCGSLVWFPSMTANDRSSATEADGRVQPVLATSFGRHLVLVRLKTIRVHGGTPQAPTVREELTMGEEPGWEHDEPIRSLQWLSHEMILLQSDSKLALFDLRFRKVTETQPVISLVSSLVSNDWLVGVTFKSRAGEEKHIHPSNAYSVRAYKGQVFFLTPGDIVVGTLITWADRILAHVSGGDFLGAIELSTDYLEGRAGGSCIGLPESREAQRPIVAQRLLDLMRASTTYAFSDERMHDGTHADPRGVDRTPLFEGLARVCAEACLALEDQTFLFDELYDTYADAGIEAIFADQMEHFIVAGQLRLLPIPVVQRLISFRKRQQRYDLAERIIWNVDPASLDLDQALSLCLERRLFDALIYVYTRALHDFVGPIVELLGIIKRRDSLEPQDNIADCYRLFSYLSVALTGHTYPNHEMLEGGEGIKARSSIYGFLFAGRCVMWPEGPGGQLVLTVADEQQEPTYPYLRLLLAFDAEAFLDALDIAFEDSYLDDEEEDEVDDNDDFAAVRKHHPRFTRQLIVSILSEVTFEEGSELQESARVFVCIFIARNAPKYPQFVRLSQPDVKQLLHHLAAVQDSETLEDRQFAAECLLSAYRPSHSDELLAQFESASFTRILHRAYRSESKWDKLADLVIVEAPSKGQETFDELAQVISSARMGKGAPSAVLKNVERIVLQSLPALVDVDVGRTAELMGRFFPARQAEAISLLDRSPHRQLAYLGVLLDPWQDSEELPLQMRSDTSLPSAATDKKSTNSKLRDSVDQPQRDLYISLLCSMEPHVLVKTLDAMPANFFDLKHLANVAEEEGVIDGALWAFDRQGQLDKGLDAFERSVAQRAFVLRDQAQEDDSRGSEINEEADAEFEEAKEQLEQGVSMAVRLCREHGQLSDPDAQKHWVRLLKILIHLVHDVTTTGGKMATRSQSLAKSFVEDSLSALVSSTSADSMPFADLFRRLLEDEKEEKSPRDKDGQPTTPSRYYAEVRPIINGMVEAYRLRQGLLGITNRLFDRDVFYEMQNLATRRRRGWRPGTFGTGTRCEGCQRLVFGSSTQSSSMSATRRPGFKRGASVNDIFVDGSASSKVAAAGALTMMNSRDGSIIIPSLDDLPKRTPSPFLEPAVSPRPDKGKGVERRPSALSLGYESAWDRDQQQEQEGLQYDNADLSGSNSGAARTKRKPTTDPCESFTAPMTPRPVFPGTNDWNSLTRPSEDYFGSASNTPGIGIEGASASLASSSDWSLDAGMKGKEDSDEGDLDDEEEEGDAKGQIVVLVNGQVWHRRCAPQWVLAGAPGPGQTQGPGN
ncbi:hypothetical protein FA10DRAFT_236886 [Acaromyces ingoldii]|uniref:Uncharacterized protein n=1 Tax=Acaromyces ingoldii TaxID=215250 RepID=A0A316YWJ1_9BASI|nr:hypothetical protein FA10DRAFT_236886 [Acaromyces ingoldii]PWN93416.1 hypothetical protein FA10DRAFT_236886 [Acaromyces ingoldii]